MHELPRVLDPIHVDADVVQSLVLLPHLLLHYSLITDIPISPPLRVIPTHIPQRRLPVLRWRPCAAAEAVGCLAAAAATAAAPGLHQLAVPDGWTGRQPRYTAAAGWLAAGVALLLATAAGTCALSKAMHGKGGAHAAQFTSICSATDAGALLLLGRLLFRPSIVCVAYNAADAPGGCIVGSSMVAAGRPLLLVSACAHVSCKSVRV